MRRLFTFFSVASLLLCTAVCVLWVRSFWSYDRLSYYQCRMEGDDQAVGFAAAIGSDRGMLWIGEYRVRHLQLPPDAAAFKKSYLSGPRWRVRSAPVGHYSQSTLLPATGPTLFALAGHELRESRVSGSFVSHGLEAGIPTWSPAALLSLAPLAQVSRRLLRRGCRSRGLCPSCGYDLRATPGRCPECGAVPEAV
jgi:hypothetical protein